MSGGLMDMALRAAAEECDGLKAELSNLRARLADRERRIRLARRVSEALGHGGCDCWLCRECALMGALDLRRPLPKRRPARRMR